MRTAGDELDIARFRTATGNNTQLRIKERRFADGTGWNTASTRLEKVVDVTPMGFIDFGIDGEDGARGLGFGNDGNTQMVLSRTGNLGVGTNTPNAILDVESTTTARFDLVAGDTNRWAEIDLFSSYNVPNERLWNIASKGSNGNFRDSIT